MRAHRLLGGLPRCAMGARHCFPGLGADNRIGLEGARALAMALKFNATLLELHLASVPLFWAHLEAVAVAGVVMEFAFLAEFSFGLCYWMLTLPTFFVFFSLYLCICICFCIILLHQSLVIITNPASKILTKRMKPPPPNCYAFVLHDHRVC